MGKIAIITGASRGIGRQVALELANADYELALIARTKSQLIELSNEIINIKKLHESQTPLIFPIDVTNENEINEAVKTIIAKKNKIDVLFNNAGIFNVGTIDVSTEDINKILKTNLLGPLNLIKAIKPYMENQKSGYIINMASRSGKYARSLGGIYAASKFGLVGLGESLYQELANYNIKVTTICPGAVNTQMTSMSGLLEEDKIKVHDIAKIVLHLLTLSDSAYVKEYIIECRADVMHNQRLMVDINLLSDK